MSGVKLERYYLRRRKDLAYMEPSVHGRWTPWDEAQKIVDELTAQLAEARRKALIEAADMLDSEVCDAHDRATAGAISWAAGRVWAMIDKPTDVPQPKPGAKANRGEG